MSVSKRLWLLCGAAAAVLLWMAGLYRVSGSVTYVERTRMNESAVQNIAITDNETVLGQEFTMPYDLFWSVEVKTGTYGRNNNSFWEVEIREKESGKKVYGWERNASQMADGEYYSYYVNHPVRVRQGEQYVITICSKDATGNSALAFYCSDTDSYAGGSLFLNGQEQEGDLCFRITGGGKDVFWGGLYVGITFLLLAAAVWCVRRKRSGKPVRMLLEAVGTACLYFIFLYVFSRSNMGNFTDECDNIRGGMLIAKGSVLYRDYYTQHTPFAYYLCAVFALLGAGNVQQFRLLYYLLLSVVWGCLYYRHGNYFGKMRMLLLPFAELWIIFPMFFQASKIMGDNIQGICMVVLVMEFLRYWEDGELGKSRSLIAAACIFISTASAFVSVFALAPVVTGVCIRESMLWKKWKKEGGSGFFHPLKRYGCLVAATAAPFGITLIYFAYSHALVPMYRMAYQFNTMVYNQYQNQYGRVKWKPFFLGVKNYLESISSNFNAMVSASGNDTAVIQCLVAAGAAAALLLWGWKRKGAEGVLGVLVLFLCMCGNGTRSGTDFHAAGMWNVALALIILTGGMGDRCKKWKEQGAVWIAAAALGCYFLQPYVTMVTDHIVYNPDIIEGVDEKVAALTVPGEKIFIDAYAHDSIYLIYKERYPVNRNCYLLPWYMDWFEQDTIDDLEAAMPEVVIYNPEVEVYGAVDFAPRLNQVIRKQYEAISEGSIIWILK